jgi:hypothetical protein
MKMFSKKYKVEDDTEDDWGFYIDTDIDSDIENAIPKINYENEYENEYENKYNGYNLCRFLQICKFSACTFIVLYSVMQLF